MARRRRTARAAAAAAAVLALAAAPGGGAAELAGRVELVERGRPAAGAEEVVLWYRPDRAVAAPAPRAAAMTTDRKRFEPRVLVVPVGSTVRFPNRDPILHNVFSVSGDNAFDLGLSGQGPGGSTRFGAAGVVRVFCNVHHRMVAHVVVVDTPFTATPTPPAPFASAVCPRAPGSWWSGTSGARPSAAGSRSPRGRR